MPKPVALIVNDDPSQLRLSAVVLEKAGFAPRTCLGAEEALALLADRPAIDLVVTDLHMPGIDGWRFCRMLRSPELGEYNATPILVVSATFSGRDAEMLSFELGASGFLAAPFAPSALQDYARALLSGRRPEPAAQALIAHADPQEAERLRGAFQRAGYEVDCAHTADAALAAWRAVQPEVAVIDDQLGDSGALLAQIKAPGSPSVACAIVADTAGRDPLALARHGADVAVAAPADPARLVELAASARRQRALLRVEELLEERGRSLRDSEARWHSLIEAIPEIVVVHDGDGTIHHINRTGAEQLGWPADECIGGDLGEIEPATNGGRSGPIGAFETVWRRRDGSEIPVEVVRRRLRFDGREALLSVARDVSARHELARQRQDFLAMLTHDIKNPLSVVRGFAELVGEVGALSDDQADLMARIQSNADTVLTLVANYLNLSQIEAGQLTISRRPVALDALLAEIVQQYRSHAARVGVTLALAADGPLGQIAADPVALERVVTNLVHNAIKFTPAGGEVMLLAHRDAEAVTVAVRDTGPGIAAEDLDAVFHLYRRGQARRAGEGTGLGLFIARQLVAAHGGEISLASPPGAGTTVTIRLPTGHEAAVARQVAL